MKNKAMTDSELLKLLKDEASQAGSFHNSEMATDQAKALEHYQAEPYGDEVTGRSKVVTHDLEDTINWIMPDLMRMFMGSDEIVELDGVTEQDELSGATRLAADYIDHVFRVDNPGDEILHDFAFDGLLQRVGVMDISWTDPVPKPPKVLEGVTPEMLVKYNDDPEYDILEQTQSANGMFALKVQQTPKMGRVVIEAVPPEEFRWSKTAKSIETAQYHGRSRVKLLSELIRLFPDYKAELEPDATSGAQDENLQTDPRFVARHGDDNSTTNNTSSMTSALAKRVLDEEYLLCDFDGDGVTELRHVKRIGDVIVENEIVERSQYVVWTPIRVSHRLAGRSFDDLLKDIQLIRTVLTRRMLDSLAQSLTQRKAVNMQLMDEEGVQDLLNNEIGDVVRASGDVRAAIANLETPDVTGAALNVLGYVDNLSEQASGVARHSQGLNPEALNKTATGIDLLQSASKVRTELIARWLAKSMERVFARILHLVVAHQDHARNVKIKGKFIDVDPRSWSDEMGVKVHVAMAASSRATQVANLSIVASKQEQILLQSPDNPIVTVAKYRNTLARMSEAMGFKDAKQFYAEVPDDYAPAAKEPAQDPKLMAVQAQIAADQAKMQADAVAREAEFAHRKEMERIEAQNARDLAMQKQADDMALAQMKIQAEAQAAADRTAAEMALARWKAEESFKLDRETNVMNLAARRHSERDARASLGGSAVRMGGQVG